MANKAANNKRQQTLNGNQTIQTQSKLLASSENDPGFSSIISPVGANMSDKRKVVTADFGTSGPGRAFTMKEVMSPGGGMIINDINTDSNEIHGKNQRSMEETQKTTIRSQKSAGSMGGGHQSRKSNSIRSLRQSQRSNHASQRRQTNDMYIVGSMDTINVNYKVDVEN